MNSKFSFRPPSLHPYYSFFQCEAGQHSPLGTADYASTLSPNESPVPKKKVTFLPIVSVILIPTKEEFFKADIAGDVWSSKTEIESYKNAARQAIQLISSTHHISPKEAVRILLSQETDDDTSSLSPVIQG